MLHCTDGTSLLLQRVYDRVTHSRVCIIGDLESSRIGANGANGAIVALLTTKRVSK